MSYLNGPRINFWGGGSTNVDTANNEQYEPQLFDLANASVVSKESDEQIIDYLRQPSGNYFAHGGWNFYGDHQVNLMQNTVSSCGKPGSVSTAAALVGKPVFLLGGIDPVSGDGPYGGPVMVDLDPTSSVTTQIYAGGLQIGYPDPVLLIRGNSVSHSHFLGLRYNRDKTQPPYTTPGSAFANGTFQLSFNREDIVSWDSSIQILQDIIEAPDAVGVVVRFSMFQFFPGFSSSHMQKNYAENRNDANPSLGRIIGSIGPLYRDETRTCAPGRLLQNNNLGGAQGLAHLDTHKQLLSLDLVSALEGAVIRQDGQANTGPIEPNVDYGELQIGTAGGTLTTAPSLPDSYYIYGGIYDVPLTAEQCSTLDNKPIAISSTQNSLSIDEIPIRIYSDQRNIYVNDSSKPLAPITLQVRELGSALRQAISVNVCSQSSGTLPLNSFIGYRQPLMLAAGTTEATFKIDDVSGMDGFLSLNFSTASAADYLVSFRKYPDDDFSKIIQAGNIPWEVVYEHCLRFFYIIFPAMSKRIPLNDEGTIKAVAGEILKRISDPYRDTTLYMPLTRALSPGKIALLKAYLQQK